MLNITVQRCSDRILLIAEQEGGIPQSSERNTQSAVSATFHYRLSLCLGYPVGRLESRQKDQPVVNRAEHIIHYFQRSLAYR